MNTRTGTLQTIITSSITALLLLLMGFGGPAQAQTADVQIIHNAADPAADTVDIYVDGNLTLDDFGFREATEYLELSSGDHTIAVAGQNSSSADDAIASFDVSLEAGESYNVIANGVLDTTNFAANPDENDIGFNLWVAHARMSSTDSEQVQFQVVHGATDAPSVDVGARGVATLVQDAAYGDITNYIGVPAQSYMLDVRLAELFSIVASFEADLSSLQGGTATVLASGFLNSSANQDGPGFGLIAVLADGTVLSLPNQTSTADVQIIHNAADPNADTVDVYINDELAIDDFGFRSATPYLSLPAGEELEIGVAPGGSGEVTDTLASFHPMLQEGMSYGYIASGVLDPGNFANNPEGIDTGFDFLLQNDARKMSETDGEFQFYINHGATDAPSVDVEVRNGPTLAEGASYTDITDYRSVAPSEYVLDLYEAGSDNNIVSFEANVSSLADRSGAVLASGFLEPSQNNDGESFGLLLALSDGTTMMLPQTETTAIGDNQTRVPNEFRLRGNYPNPFNPSTQVRFDLASAANVTLTMYNMLGQEVRTIDAGRMAAGASQSIEVDANGLTSGNYIYRLQIDSDRRSITKTGKMMLVK